MGQHILCKKILGIILLVLTLPICARSQSDITYIDGPYHVSAGSNVQWYGDVEIGPNAELYIENGEKIEFYGTNFKVHPGARIIGADNAWQNFTQGSGSGTIVFKQPNPNDGTYRQQLLDGGNPERNASGLTNTFPTLEINNNKGVMLVNTATRIGSELKLTNGYLFADVHNVILTNTATITGYTSNRYVVTGTTGHLVKEGFNTQYLYPIGQDTNDYTPVIITPTAFNTVGANVYSYTKSPPNEIGMNGMSRTWNIYAENATGAQLVMQHNSSTNQSAFISSNNFITRYGQQPNNTGDFPSPGNWQSNSPSASVVGTIPGSEQNSRTYATLATDPLDNTAFYSKSSNRGNPLPVKFESFVAFGQKCDALLQWKVGVQGVIDHFIIQSSEDGGLFSNLVNVRAVNSTNASYQRLIPQEKSKMYYRIIAVEVNGTETISQVGTVITNCGASERMFAAYPNPVQGMLTVTGLKEGEECAIVDMAGRILRSARAMGSSLQLDMIDLPAAAYTLVVTTNGQQVFQTKILKKE